MKNITRKNKIKIKNTVYHLLSAFCNHEDCLNWLKGKICNTLSDKSDIPADTPEFYKKRAEIFAPV